eukprot:m.780705 g.780705  ORF g.780705 m.780705 type:complete len:425 (+) comp23283_c1_seq3:585-1859(+)
MQILRMKTVVQRVVHCARTLHHVEPQCMTSWQIPRRHLRGSLLHRRRGILGNSDGRKTGDTAQSSSTRQQKSSNREPRNSTSSSTGGWRHNSAYGSVANQSNERNGFAFTERVGKDIHSRNRGHSVSRTLPVDSNPWDQLRARGERASITAAEYAEKRKQKRKQAGNNNHGQESNRQTRTVITARSNPLVVQCRKLLREQTRKKAGVVKIEGAKFILECLDAGWVPELILCGTDYMQELSRHPTLKGFDMLQECSDAVVQSCLSQPRLEPVLAVGPIPHHDVKKPQRAVLIGVQDPHNLGSLLRSSVAFGVEKVFLMPGTPDPYNPLVLRASTGAAMHLAYGTEDDALQCHHLPVIAASAHGGAKTLTSPLRDGRFLLVLGHETRGVPRAWLERGRLLTIPVEVESLGAAVAGAVVLDRLVNRL